MLFIVKHKTYVMKKMLSAAFTGSLLLLLQANTTSSRAKPAAATAINTNNNRTTGQAWLTYYWYADDDFTTYTGYSSSIEMEVNRLRASHPSYNFSSTPAIGMDEFEYGMHPFYVTAVIYSNM